MLRLLDVLLTIVHLVVIGFNMLGWIWPGTRKLHLIVVLLTAASWLVLGIWYGFGYCPITDWQWEVKERLGETNLPNSFIKYMADRLSGSDIDAGYIDAITGVVFALAALLAVYFNFIKKKPRQKGTSSI